jgi:hypothetical protein
MESQNSLTMKVVCQPKQSEIMSDNKLHEQSDRGDSEGLTEPRSRLTEKGVCEGDCRCGLTEKTQHHGNSSTPLLLFMKFLSICRSSVIFVRVFG